MIIRKGSDAARDRAVRLSMLVRPMPSLMLMLSECTKWYVASGMPKLFNPLTLDPPPDLAIPETTPRTHLHHLRIRFGRSRTGDARERKLELQPVSVHFDAHPLRDGLLG